MSLPEKEKDTQPRQILIETEEDRLKRHIYRSDKEKLQAFTKMLRRGIMLKNAKITHR